MNATQKFPWEANTLYEPKPLPYRVRARRAFFARMFAVALILAGVIGTLLGVA